MNVYDFDGTIYDGDSSVDFYRFCMKRHKRILKRLSGFLTAVLKYKLKHIDKAKMKEVFFSFLQDLDNPEAEVHAFWLCRKDRIKSWYISRKRTDDLIISASPEFLLEPICRHLKVNLIASEVDIHTGRFLSTNCRGEEKVRRFRLKYPDGHIAEFYSDSSSDLPMAEIADKPFLVKGSHITQWKTN